MRKATIEDIVVGARIYHSLRRLWATVSRIPKPRADMYGYYEFRFKYDTENFCQGYTTRFPAEFWEVNEGE